MRDELFANAINIAVQTRIDTGLLAAVALTHRSGSEAAVVGPATEDGTEAFVRRVDLTLLANRADDIVALFPMMNAESGKWFFTAVAQTRGQLVECNVVPVRLMKTGDVYFIGDDDRWVPGTAFPYHKRPPITNSDPVSEAEARCAKVILIELMRRELGEGKEMESP